MSAIRFMKFTCANGSGQLYFVGADAEEMRKDAKLFDSTADTGTEVNSEQVIDACVDPLAMPFVKHGVAAARAGTKSFYLFSA